MLFIAKFAMQGPRQAWTTLAGLAVLTLWFSPVGFLAGAVLALITLRVGETEGLKGLGVGLVTLAVASLIMTGSALPGLIAAGEFLLPAWGFALVLRRTNDMGRMILWAVWIAALMVLAFHLWVSDPVAWWRTVFQQMLEASGNTIMLDEQTWDQIARLATTMAGMSFVMLWISMVLLARWWQGVLYHPGQFQKDFHALALPRQLGWVMGILALVGLFTHAEPAVQLISDLFAVLSAGLMFQGLAVLHAIVAARKWGRGWLIALYVLLLLFPQMVILLALMALLDMWLDMRKYYATPSN